MKLSATAATMRIASHCKEKMKTPTFLVAALLACAAQAEIVDVTWSADGAAAREFTVAPGKFAEWCTTLRRGDKVRWQFEAAQPVNFNVHYHVGKDIHFPARQDQVTRLQGTLEVAADQDYCWMWSSKRAGPVAVKAALAQVR